MKDIRTLFGEEVNSKSKAISNLWALISTKDSMLSQRAKYVWLKEDDANTICFHASIKSKSIRNSILAIKVEGFWVEGVADIRQEVVKYFSERIKEQSKVIPTLSEVSFRSILEEDNQVLSSPFLKEELGVVVAQSELSKRLLKDDPLMVSRPLFGMTFGLRIFP